MGQSNAHKAKQSGANRRSKGGREPDTLPPFSFQTQHTHMNALRNRVLLIGRLGQDPERIEFDGDKVKVNLRLATNEVYRNAKARKPKRPNGTMSSLGPARRDR